MSVRLALLDRDGTLNRKAPEGEWITAVDQLELLPGAEEAVRRLNGAGIPVAVVTNQRAIALGRLSEARLARIHAVLEARLERAGARLDAIYHCPHERGTCGCRKPQPGMLEAAARAFGVPLADAVMIGDSAVDVEAGHRAGTRTVRLAAAAGHAGPEDPGPAADSAPPLGPADRATALDGLAPSADFVAPDLLTAVGRLLG